MRNPEIAVSSPVCFQGSKNQSSYYCGKALSRGFKSGYADAQAREETFLRSFTHSVHCTQPALLFASSLPKNLSGKKTFFLLQKEKVRSVVQLWGFHNSWGKNAACSTPPSFCFCAGNICIEPILFHSSFKQQFAVKEVEYLLTLKLERQKSFQSQDDTFN